MRRFRVAITADPEIPVPPQLYGGIERIVETLANGLIERGHVVDLYANASSQTKAKLIPFHGTSTNSINTLMNSLALAKGAWKSPYDLVHSFGRLAYLTPIMPFWIPKLMTYQRQITLRSVQLSHYLSAGTMRYSAVSRALAAPVEHIGKWYVIYNGVSLAKYTFQREVAPDAPLVFLGRIEHIKGTHVAIEISRMTGLKLIVAGNVPRGHEQYFEEKVRPHLSHKTVSYIGPVNDCQKNDLLGRCRALLMPILWEEPFGIVMAEALACGTPVIGFHRGSVPEVVENGVSGYVGRDLSDLVTAVREIAGISREACRLRAETLFSDKAMTDAYLRVYSEIAPYPSGQRT